MEAVQVDGGEDFGDVGSGDMELDQEFDFAAGDGRFHMQFAGDVNEIFLQDLERDYAGAGATMLGDEARARRCLAGAALSSA